MKLKSLLLGSAAALVAFSGARAADAVIAQPEPVEYVRICDAYGAGYFFIPGTETCLKIGGFVRYDIDMNSNADVFGKTTLASIQLTAKSDTEMGTLESFIDLRTNFKTGYTKGNGDNAAILDSVYLSLGGLKMGKFDNAFDGGLVGEYDELGGAKGNTIGYTFASEGFDATINLDHAKNETNYIPNISANAGFAAGAFAVRAFVAYDEEVESFAAKLRVGADVTEGGRLEAAVIYSDDAKNYSFGAANWSVAAAYQQKVSDTITLAVTGQYWNEVSVAVLSSVGVAGFAASDGFDNGSSAYAIGANVDWKPVKNFLVRAQVQYFVADNGSVDGDVVKGRIRFQRSF